jgi:aminoglycoside/choline kinase family phosphotransferase
VSDKHRAVTHLRVVVRELLAAGFSLPEIMAMSAAASLEIEMYGEPGSARRLEADEDERETHADRIIRNRLRERIALSMYPEHAQHLDQIERALVLLACGLGHVTLDVDGEPVAAALLVAILGLDDLVEERLNYLRN